MAGEGIQGVLFHDLGREDYDTRTQRDREIHHELFVRPELEREARRRAKEAEAQARRLLESQLFLEATIGAHVLNVSLI